MEIGTDLKEHPFFQFEEPDDQIASLSSLRSALESAQQVFKVGPIDSNSNDELLVSSFGLELPLDTSHALNRAIRLMKRYLTSNPKLVDDCSIVMAYLCGECTRPSVEVRVAFEGTSNVDLAVSLPDFGEGDVGFRLWGACFLFSRILLSMDLKEKVIIELGAASGLCGLVSASIEPTCKVYLTDFNQACLKAAKLSAHQNKLNNVKVEHVDWTQSLDDSIPWLDSILIGAAIVYEQVHGKLVLDFLAKAFTRGAQKAIVAIHREHSGHDQFMERCKEVFFMTIIDSRIVQEELYKSHVVVVEILPKKLIQ